MPAGNTARSASSASRSGRSRALDVGHEVEDVAVALDLHVLADGDGARPRDPPEVVPAEVDQHDVLRPLLRVALELLGEELVLALASAPRGRVPAIGWVVRRSPSTWRRSSGLAPTTSNDGVRTKNRYGLGLTRRRARYRPIPSIGRPVGRVGRQVERLAPGQDDLDGLAGRDRVLRDLDRVDVGVAPEARVDPVVPRAAWRRSRSPPKRRRRARVALGRAVRSSASKIARSAIR